MPNYRVGKNLQSAASFTFPTETLPLRGSTPVTITSPSPDRVQLSRTPIGPGSSSISVLAGPQFYVRALSDQGSVRLTLSSEGYAETTSEIFLTPAGFLLTSSGGFPLTPFSAPVALGIQPVSIDPSGAITGQGIRGDLPDVTVQLANSNPEVGVLRQTSVTFHAGDFSQRTELRPLTAGTTTVTLEPPAGFEPVPGRAGLTLTVSTPSLSFSTTNVFLGKDLQVENQVRSDSALPTPVTVTITSRDPARVLVSKARGTFGSGAITLSLPTESQFFLQALGGDGAAVVDVSGPGFRGGTMTVQLYPSGFVVNLPSGIFTPFSQPRQVTVSVAPLDPVTLASFGGGFPSATLRAGFAPVNVNVSSSDPTVGVITTSSLVFSAGDFSKLTTLRPLKVGTTSVSTSVPAGFSQPSTGNTQVVLITEPRIALSRARVGKDLQTGHSFRLNAPAPAGGLTMQLRSTDPSRLLLSISPTVAGAAGISVPVPANTDTASFVLHGLAGSGTVQVVASAPGFVDSSVDMDCYPSGFVFAPTNPVIPADRVSSPPTILAGLLDPLTLQFIQQAEIRRGISPVRVDVTSSNPSVIVVENSPLLFSPGEIQKPLQIRAVAPGDATLTLSTPAGFTTPSQGRELTLTVQ